jgi:hypothetical protein
MFKFKLTLSSGMVIEHIGPSMIAAIKWVESWYDTLVIKAEQVF